MASELDMETVNREADWNPSTPTDSQLVQTLIGNTNRRKLLKIIGICVGIAAITAIGLTVGLVLGLKDKGSNSTPTPEVLPAPCVNIRTTCPWTRRNPLLLIGLKGFRADYLNRKRTPVLKKLQQCGIQTPYLRPVFPTKSYPNQYTIVTGLYPESHGIVNDEMFDPVRKTVFSGTESQPHWWGGEPLWVTAKKQGKMSASCNWAGSNIELAGGRPELQCNRTEDREDIVRTIVTWLTMDENSRPDFISVYFNEPGTTARNAGPDSPEVSEKVKEMDGVIGELMTGLQNHGIDNCVNIVILSDHGMSDTSCSRQVSLPYLVQELPQVENLLMFGGRTGLIYTNFIRNGTEIIENIDDIPQDNVTGLLTCRSSHLKAFTDATTPIRHHYTNNDRIGDVVFTMEDKWLLRSTESSQCPNGSGGYDAAYESMHAIFLGYGPDFETNLVVEPFENVEIYNLLSDLLGIHPASNNGTTGTLNHILRYTSNNTTPSEDYIQIMPREENHARQTLCTCNRQVFDLDQLKAPDLFAKEMSFPFGFPTLYKDMTAWFLHSYRFSTIFSSDNKQPITVSYQLTLEQAQNFKHDKTACTLPDKRLDTSVNPDCKEYTNTEQHIDAVHLFDDGFAKYEDDMTESFLSSNVVPMYRTFREETWSFVVSLITAYAIRYGGVHVSVGPAFDRNRDGKADLGNQESSVFVNNDSKVPIPTHFYVILLKCHVHGADIKHCKAQDLDILSFVFPHVKREKGDCGNKEHYLKDSIVRIRDIELLTGLRLMTKFDSNTAARKRTFMPTELWPSDILDHWVDLPCDNENTCPSDYRPLLVISLDGFRADFLRRNLTPAIEKLGTCGVQAPYMRSMFPTETYPNHYTIVTGLYPESHGIVENDMYDSQLNSSFNENTEQHAYWWGGEPIWVTARSQGKRSASAMWIGSDVDNPWRQPSILSKWSDTLQDGIEQTISWLTTTDGHRPDLITLYLWQPDDLGHWFGPESTEMDDELKYVDYLVQLLMDALLRNNLHNCVNIMVVSDHGMAEESCQRQVALNKYFPAISDVYSYLSTRGFIDTRFTKNGSSVVPNENGPSVEDIVEALECKDEHYSVYTKETLPVRYHYTNNNRLGDIVLDVEDGWIVRNEVTDTCSKGNHGYDPVFQNMHAVFVAHGPAFKQQFITEPFENIELYNIMADVIGVSPAPNNGTAGALDDILRRKPGDENKLISIEQCKGNHERTSSCSCGNITVPIPISFREYIHFALEEEPLAVCSLLGPGYMMVYSKDNRQPAVVSFSVFADQVSGRLPHSTSCVIADSRLTKDDNPDCSQYENDGKNVTRVPLFNPDFLTANAESTEATFSSNMVPMYSGFLTNIWTRIVRTISQYATRYRNIYVSLGPVFDRNHDGRADGQGIGQEYVGRSSGVPIPTHYFVILMKCQDDIVAVNSCDVGFLDILSFIIPHVDRIPNCLSIEAFLKKNVVRIRDVELLTGIRFLTDYKWTTAARKRTYLPEELWSFE